MVGSQSGVVEVGKGKKGAKERPGIAPLDQKLAQWRVRAIHDFSYLHPIAKLLSEETCSIYELFFTLLPYCVKLHESGADWELQRIYDFADWCWRRQDNQGLDLSNAAGTAFYEHLVENVPLRRIAEFVKPDLIEMLVRLSETRRRLKLNGSS
jgi:hypothetical protein